MAEKNIPFGNNSLTANLLPNFYQTPSNKKFLQATLDQLYQPGTASKINGYVGRKTAKSTVGSDLFIDAPTKSRQDYQLEPSVVIEDSIGNTSFFKDYQDYINQINVFGGNTKNHARLNKQEMYSWDPHINWDMFVNFQNYYWMPYGPETIHVGKAPSLSSRYTVSLATKDGLNSYVFTPDGETHNPLLKLYKGQTYTFVINSPGNPFSFKTARTTGTASRYDIDGINGAGVEVGVITFTVPGDAPSLLFYQSETDVNLGGVIEISTVSETFTLDVENEVIGKAYYTLGSGVALSNGMKIEFSDNVVPASYANNKYYVDGVGSSIRLILESELEIINPFTTSSTIKFDSSPFDSEPFSDATGFADIKDYIVINRTSSDKNTWSRYNRWFHKDVIIASAEANGNVASLDQSARAVRPIIEFEANLKLFNLGTTAIKDVDLIDTYTKDVFSTIEGSRGYNIDGIELIDNQIILFTADTDPMVANKSYRVTFVNILGYRQIHLEEVNSPEFNQVALIKQGVTNQSKLYWFNGTTWVLGQQKTAINQLPLFDIFDDSGYSYGDTNVYPSSTFKGTSIFTYKVGTGVNDPVLGFPLSYQNVSNVGDIVFNFTLATDTFEYKTDANIISKKIDVGYLYKQGSYVNGWQICKANAAQAAVRVYKNSNKVNNFDLDIFDDITNLDDLVVKVYVNGLRIPATWTVENGPTYKQIVLANDITTNDVLTIRAFAAQPINENGYYEIPANLQSNPLNSTIGDFTLGEVINHVDSIIDNIYYVDADGMPEVTHYTSDVIPFVGVFPGQSNLRDLGNVTQYGTKFVQHSGPISLSLYHITSESNNIIRAIEQARDDFNSFKRTFISTAATLGVDGDPITIFNLILKKINLTKPTVAPYYFSDMVAYGANLRTDLKVVDYRIKKYPLSQTFTLDKLSSKAVYVYLNGVQLVHGKDYTFDSQGFIIVSATIATGDTISTYEYENTAGSFVPETPTKLGLWPKYEPKLYLDTSLVTPRWMIQGHDGSQTLAYGSYGEDGQADYRDDLILELEKRIFNNIKVEYDPSIFDITDLMPRYNKASDYSFDEFNEVLAPNYYKWTTYIGGNFNQPLNYDVNNPFSFNYSKNTTPNGDPAPGYWRGVYRWLLDTDRPHICPWECLGLSIEPTWWQEVYGPAPYTSDNRVLWEDLSKGAVKEPGAPIVYLEKYAKPFLATKIPVNEYGDLISPLEAGLAFGTLNSSTRDGFVFGDVAPVEAAWRRSSHYPFSVLITCMLLSPAKVFGLALDRSRIKRNAAGQLVYTETGLRITPADILLPSVYSSKTSVQTAGIINYVVDLIFNYIFSNNVKSYSKYAADLSTMTVRLSYRLGSFTNKSNLNLLLDSKTPSSTGSVFIPKEDFAVILNKSNPVKKVTYSGVIITRLASGFEVRGYSKTQPYFKYYQYNQSGTTINVGGISEGYTVWTPGQQYVIGSVVKFGDKYYRATVTSTSSTNFEHSAFQSLPSLPIIGGQNATLRRSWDRSDVITVPYGTEFGSVQEVVDFLLGYGEWLKDQGFIFDEFNTNLESVSNWLTSAKEFMFWSTQNWSSAHDKWNDWAPDVAVQYGTIVRYNGEYYSAVVNVPADNIFDPLMYDKLEGLSTVGNSVISLSPAANKLTLSATLMVIDDISNPFNSYETFRVDGTPIQPSAINLYKEGSTFSYSTSDGTGIYSASFYLVQHEHVAIIKNTTIFNDVIYNLESGYRRDRIGVSAYVTTGWDGSLNIPGFIFDQAAVEQWKQWQDYNIGDVVAHQGFYYSANVFIPGSTTFDLTDWVKLSHKPNSQILPNWTNVATQFTNFYDLDSDSLDVSSQKIAQHLIGYQKRSYLGNIIQDDVSEFKFYQGMIREKGTQNVLNSLFGTLGLEGKDSLTFYEEWALRVGQYGAKSAFEEFEVVLDDAAFKNNPQGILFSTNVDPEINNFIIQQTPTDIYLAPLGYESKPFPALTNPQPMLRSAGYVNAADAFLSLGSLSDIVKYDITTFPKVCYVWCAFDSISWNVYKFKQLNAKIVSVSYSNNTVTITTDGISPVKEGDYIGISQVSILQGFYKIETSSLNKFTFTSTIKNFPSSFTETANVILHGFVSHRIDTINELDTISSDGINASELVWVDNSATGSWETWEHTPSYKSEVLADSAKQDALQYGSAIAMSKDGKSAVVGTGIGVAVNYIRVGDAVPWSQRQVIPKPFISPSTLITTTGSITANSTTILVSNAMNEMIGADIVGPGIQSNTTVISVSPGVSITLSKPASSTISNGTLVISTNSNKSSDIATVLAVSDDGVWLATGSPRAGNAFVKKYKGAYNQSTVYAIGDVVSQGIFAYSALVAGTLSTPTTPSSQWTQLPYVPVSKTGTATGLSAHGVVSLYKKDTNDSYQLVDTFISPALAANELFGSSLKFATLDSNVTSLFIGATGYNNNTGRVYRLDYGQHVNLTTGYNPLGSADIKLVVQSTVGILVGMVVSGAGYTSGQTVAKVVNSTTLIMSAAPDSIPSGTLSFAIAGWGFRDSTSANYVGAAPGNNFGNAIAVAKSSNRSVLAISAANGTTVGYVKVYKDVRLSIASTSIQTLTGTASSFGKSIALSDAGDFLAISDNLETTAGVNQAGNVSVYAWTGTEYSIQQTLKNHQPTASGQFGNQIYFMDDYKSIVVYSVGGSIPFSVTFDNNTTTFDKDDTKFISISDPNGRIDVYDRYDTNWVYAESLLGNYQEPVGYGTGIAVGVNNILVSSPYATDSGYISGKVYAYSKLPSLTSWTIKDRGITVPDVKKIKKAFLYNKNTGNLLTHLDIIDPLQGKIAGPAEEEIRFKTFYDPAIYSVGTSNLTVDAGAPWQEKNVGMIWWDLRTTKFVNNYFEDIIYRTTTWNTLAAGASVDIYEWVASSMLPSKWDAIADTPAGLASNISGTSLYGDSAYSVKKTYDNVSKSFKNTYYYWVKNKKLVPNVPGRHISALDVSNLISNPRGQGYTCLALTGQNSLNLINAKNYLTGADVVLSIEYWTTDKTDQNIHSQWKIISNDPVVSLPSIIEQKWFDSLCGVDAAGRSVPDVTLPPKLRYGVENRPRQGMFVNRIEALKEVVERVNMVLIDNQINSETRDVSDFDRFEEEPNVISGLYDSVLDTDLELPYANVGSFETPELTLQLSNGKVTGINIISAGKGYIVPPYIDVVGYGINAVLRATIDSVGSITGVDIINPGEGYSSSTTTCTIRSYSVLVHSDTSATNSWAIYSFEPATQSWVRTRTQNYDVRKYRTFVDWYATGFNQFTVPDYAVNTFVDLSTINPAIGELVKVRTTTAGNWMLLEKYASVDSIDWTLSYRIVGLQNGTLQLSRDLYDFIGTVVGFDSTTYGIDSYDVYASTELRIIFNALKDKILINELKQSYLDLFFASVRYAHSEQVYLDWIFKTSFVRATYNLGMLDQPVNYPVDNLSNFEDYISEVKPYRTKVREYISNYTSLDTSSSAVTDFDLQPVYNNGNVSLINAVVTNGAIEAYGANTTYPWKFWYDNAGYSITELVLTSSGSGYAYAPTVKITSNSGDGATAIAYIASGKVNRVVLVTPGAGYLSAPTVELIGGLSSAGVAAKAVAIIGNSPVRSNLIGIKFDRTTSATYISQLEQTATFTGTESRLQFPLTWGPDIRIGKSSVTVNGTPILRENYTLSVVESTAKGFTSYSGLITFKVAPSKGASIVVSYVIDESLLNAVDRISHYYDPDSGNFGKDLAQLMTGIDYGGVIVNGLNFDVSSGWETAPYFTDKWDNFDPTFTDYSVTVAAGRHHFELPDTMSLESSDLINVYHSQAKSTQYTNTDGITKNYAYDLTVSKPVVTVSKNTTASGYVSTTYTAVNIIGSFVRLSVANTTGIVVGMGIVGTGFDHTQRVVEIVDSTTVTLNVVPNVSLLTNNQALTFTFNAAANKRLTVASTVGILEGDVVTSSSPIFTYNTTVTQIIDSHNVLLDKILYRNVSSGTVLTFSRKLSSPAQVDFQSSGVLALATAPVAGSVITVTGPTEFVRIDDINYGTNNQTNDNAVMVTPTGSVVTAITVYDVGNYTRIPSITLQASPLASSSPSFNATAGAVTMKATSAIITNTGAGYAVGDSLTVTNSYGTVKFNIDSLNTTTGVVVGTVSGTEVILDSTEGISVGDSFTITGAGGGGLNPTNKYYVSAVVNSTNIKLANTFSGALAGEFIVFTQSTISTVSSQTVFVAGGTVGTPKQISLLQSSSFTSTLTKTPQATTTNSTYGSGCTLVINYGIASIEVSSAGGGYITKPTVYIGKPWVANSAANLNDDIYYGNVHYLVTAAGTFDNQHPGHITGIVTYGTVSLQYIGTIATALSTIEKGIVTIPANFTVLEGDTFTFRKSTSDGSILPSSADYDTAITGGDLAYSTATGIAADDIVIDGDNFVTPTTSPAPEEVVPGQVVDAVAIKVYDRPNSGSAAVKVDNHVSDGVSTRFTITQLPNSSRAVIVKVGSNIKTYIDDYTIDYAKRQVVLNTPATANEIISIFSVGFSGTNILDIDYFVGDGTTMEFLTKAKWFNEITSLVYVNGEVSDPLLFKTDSTYATENVVGIKFGQAPAVGDLISYIIVKGTEQTFAITNSEVLATDGSSVYTLQNLVGKTLPNESNMIVRVNQQILTAPNSVYFTIGKNRLNYKIDNTIVPPRSATIDNILVTVDGEPLALGVDYNVDLSGITVTINRLTYTTYAGKKLAISVLSEGQYIYTPSNNTIRFGQPYDNTYEVEVISSYVHDVLDIERTTVSVTSTAELTAGSVEYFNYKDIAGGLIYLDRVVLDASYVWVIKSNKLLVPEVDYILNNDYKSIKLTDYPETDDKISIMTFSSNILEAGISYMQFKDMLNRVSYKRLNLNKRTELAVELRWDDTTITVADGSILGVPSVDLNRPGVVEIAGERIEYFGINGNVLSKLRRGTLGTGVRARYKAGSFVQDIGASETIPYTDGMVNVPLVSDGSTTINLDFTPKVKYYNSTSKKWANEPATGYTSVPVGIEVFVGNTRLHKIAYTQHDVTVSPYSPEGDVVKSAEFTVSGSQITLASAPAVGTQILVVKRTGQIWDSETNILEDRSKIANFIKAEPGIWYTGFKDE